MGKTQEQPKSSAKAIFYASLPRIMKWLVFQILAGAIPLSAIAAFHMAKFGFDKISWIRILSTGELFIACSIAGIAAIGNSLPTKLRNDGPCNIGKPLEVWFVSFEMFFVGLCAIMCVISAVFYAILRSHELLRESKMFPIIPADDFSKVSLLMYLVVFVFGCLLIILREARR